MGIPVTFNGLSVIVPENNDQGWGSDVTALLVQLATYAATNTGFNQSVRVVTASTASPTSSDFAIGMNYSGGASTVTLPSGTTGQLFAIYDFIGQAATNPVTINATSPDTINGAASYIINSSYGSVVLQYTGTQWVILAGYSLTLRAAQRYQQSATNPSFVAAGIVPAATITTVPNNEQCDASFVGCDTIVFTVSAGSGRSFICMTSYASANISAIYDPYNLFLPTFSGTGIYVYKSAASNAIGFRNLLGSSVPIEIKSLTTDLNTIIAWS